ncbi:alpha/beta hydrolase [Bacillus sp. BHET2]|uniref:alpha/beta hydrolase n=1 Tax=Bacillus sp. BHET2 TaxID=2583818 RepID=UPI00110D8795|nr:alpha/beta hydrolase [Bacillus sp. BHET2]TMU84364.1 alpha/beta hydrolase [Bacillus sp. BHET2]
MNMTANVIKGYRDMDVPYTLLNNVEKAEGIAILLPGLGYTVQAPLLHYSTGIYLNKGFDVLHINYQYTTRDYEGLSVEEIDDALKVDVKKVLEHIFKEKSYSHVYIVAKSFGTIALSDDLAKDYLQDAKLVWLTPLLKEEDVFQALLKSEQQGICIIGDEDRQYQEDRFNELKTNPRLQLHLIKGANHSLEHDFHVLDSLITHKEIMSVIEAF